MAAYKKLIAGIAFLVLQAIVVLINGLPKIEAGAYGAGYLIGYLAPGIIGIILLIVHFISKRGV